MLDIKKSIDNCAVVTIANSVQAYLLTVSHKNLNDAFSRTNVILKGGQKRLIRVLVSKLGLDGHDRGALVICRALKVAGMEVIYSGLFCTPEQVAKVAIDEDVDAVAMSLLNGAYLRLFPKVRSLLNKQGAKNILVIGGGIIPQKDKKIVEKHGVHGNFGPGDPLSEIIEYIRKKSNR